MSFWQTVQRLYGMLDLVVVIWTLVLHGVWQPDDTVITIVTRKRLRVAILVFSVNRYFTQRS
jgi:hypothetical protein